MPITYNGTQIITNTVNSNEVLEETYNGVTAFKKDLGLWTYIGTSGTYDYAFNRGSLPRCDSSEAGAQTWINANYPTANYPVGTIVRVSTTSGFFPNTVVCSERYFIRE